MDLKNATINIILGNQNNYYNAESQQQQQANVVVQSRMGNGAPEHPQSFRRTTRAQARCADIEVQKKRQAERSHASPSVTDDSLRTPTPKRRPVSMPPNFVPQVVLDRIDTAAAMEQIRNGTYRLVDRSLAKVANSLNDSRIASRVANDDSGDESSTDRNSYSNSDTSSEDTYDQIIFPANEKHSTIRSIYQLIDECIRHGDRFDGFELYEEDEDDIKLVKGWKWLCDETDWGRRIAIETTKLESLCQLNSAKIQVSTTRSDYMKDFVSKRIHARSTKNRFYEAAIKFDQPVREVVIGKLVPRFTIDAHNNVKWSLFVIFKDPKSNRYFWFQLVDSKPTVHKELVFRCIKCSSRRMDDLTSCPAMLKLRLPNTSNRIEDFFYTDVECFIVNGTHACSLCVCDALVNENSADFGITQEKWTKIRGDCIRQIKHRLQHQPGQTCT